MAGTLKLAGQEYKCEVCGKTFKTAAHGIGNEPEPTGPEVVEILDALEKAVATARNKADAIKAAQLWNRLGFVEDVVQEIREDWESMEDE